MSCGDSILYFFKKLENNMNFVLIHFLTFSIHCIIKKKKTNNMKIFYLFFI